MPLQGIIIDAPALDVYAQMAFDELRAELERECFVLRFFNWQGAGATFGYAQNSDEARKALPAHLAKNITRRPTGGGVVPHETDLTYSCIFPCDRTIKPNEIYRKLHTAVMSGLIERGVKCFACGQDLSSREKYLPSVNTQAAQCFINPVSFDLADEGGKKILGGALRRFEDIVLYQGSLQLKDARTRQKEFELAIMQNLAKSWDIKWKRQSAETDFLGKVQTLAQTKYRAGEWIDRF